VVSRSNTIPSKLQS